MEENQEDAIMEEREELMVSPSGGNPTRRPAYFLKPSVTSIEGPVLKLPSGTFRSPTSTPNVINLPLKGAFPSRRPILRWKTWFDRMHSLHKPTWEKAGIYEAIVSSNYNIQIDKTIVLGFAERWRSDTNTFVFDWGEGTITLEDVMVLGGYSVLGNSVFTPLETKESVEINEKLMKGRSECLQSKAQKPSQNEWVKLFMGSGSEIEHEAFLALWLSRHVFPYAAHMMNKNVHNIAIHLARGTRIALAPAVLSWLYRDLRLLRNAIFSSFRGKKNAGLKLWAPMQLVQIWAWERFPTLRPQPNPLKSGEPRMAKWNNLKKKNIENMGRDLNSAGESFQWRPYAISEKNWEFPKFYKEREEWVPVCLRMDENFESFARILRPCELVGNVDSKCIEVYLPHRVAMQFGMDQDLPGLVARFKGTREIAWENYNRPIKDRRLYVPPRLFESDVTTRYLEGWKQSKLLQKDAVKGAKEEKSITKSSGKSPHNQEGKKVGKDALGTLPKRNRVEAAKSGGKDQNSISITKSPSKSPENPKGKNGGNDALLTSPKRKRVEEVKPVEKDKRRLVNSDGNKMSGDGNVFPCSQPQIPSCLNEDTGTGKKMESQGEQGETTVRGEVVIGGSHRHFENETENSVGTPSNNGVSLGKKGGNLITQSTTDMIDIPGLFARTNKLEIVVARLKAEKLGLRSVKKLAKD